MRHSVVGAGARIAEPISVANSLIFPDTEIVVTDPVDRAIFTADHIVDCKYWLDERGAPRSANGNARMANRNEPPRSDPPQRARPAFRSAIQGA